MSTASGKRLAMLAAGFTIWASAFVALYAMLSVGCRFGWDGIELAAGVSLQRAQLAAIFLVHLAAGAWLATTLRPCPSSGDAATALFLRRAAWGAAVAALASTAFSFFGVFMLTACH